MLSALKALGLAGVFVVSAVLGLIAHLDLPPSRALIARLSTDLLNDTLRGSFRIGSVERANASGVVLRDVVVRDPGGKKVLAVSRLRAQASVFPIAWDILFGPQKITLVIDHVHIDRAEAMLIERPGESTPSIAAAFTPRPRPPSPTEGRHVRVVVRDVELSKGRTQGTLFGSPRFEARLAGVRGKVLATPAGAEVVIGRFPISATGLLPKKLDGIATFSLQAPGWLLASLQGYVGRVELGAVVQLEGERLSGHLDLPGAEPGDVRDLFPAYPLTRPAEAELSFSGELPLLNARGRIEVGKGQLRFEGPVLLEGSQRTELTLVGTDLGVDSVIEGAPPSAIDLLASLGLFLEPQGVRLDLTCRSQAAELGGVPIPPVDLVARLDDRTLRGRAHAVEPGLPLDLGFSVGPEGVELTAETPTFQLERAPRVRAAVPGRGRTRLKAKATIRDRALSAEAWAQLEGVEIAGIAIRRGRVEGRLAGNLDRPEALQMKASLEGQGLKAGDFSFEGVQASAEGSWARPKVEVSLKNQQGPSVEGRAFVSSREGRVSIDELSVGVRRGTAELRGRVQKLEVSESAVLLKEVELLGLGGKLSGSADIRPHFVTLEARGQELNLGQVSELLGGPARGLKGQIDLHADLVLAKDMERAFLNLGGKGLSLGGFDDLDLDATVRLVDGRVDLGARARTADLGSAEARLGADLERSVLDPDVLEDATGEAELSLHDADLGRLAQKLHLNLKPATVSGRADLNAKLTRNAPRGLPDLAVIGRTQGLGVSLARPAEDAWALSAIDAQFGVYLRGDDGNLDATLKLLDEHGILGSATLTSTLDVERALSEPAILGDLLRQAPVLGKVLIDERPLDHFPAPLRPEVITGSLRLEASLSGTLESPEILARGSLSRFEVIGAIASRPFDLCSTLGYSKKTGEIFSTGEVFLSSRRNREACSGRRVAQLSLKGHLLDPSTPGPGFEGVLTGALQGLPLEAIPGLADRGVGGRVSGKATVAQIGGVPRISANLQVKSARVDKVDIGNGKLEVRSNPTTLGATLELSHEGGKIEATGLAALSFKGPVPTLDPDQPVGLRIVAKNADAVVLSPFTQGILRDVGGRLDAKVTARLIPTKLEDGPRYDSEIDGEVALQEGTMQIVALGLRLSEVELSGDARSDEGMTRLSFDQVSAQGGDETERISISGAQVWIKGIDLVRAEGLVSTSQLPLLVEGVPLANATTRQPIGVQIERTKDRMVAAIDVPNAILTLPQSSTRDVIGLDDNPAIEVMQPLGQPAPESSGGVPWLFSIHLGDQVKLTRSDLDLPISGTTHILLGDKTEVTGIVQLSPGGRLQVAGKTFVIDLGEVYFDTGDNGNPRLRVRAIWRAPDGTVVTAEVTGTVKTAELRLFSDPARSEQEIYALLLGGSGSAEGGNARVAGAGVGADLLGSLLVNTPLSQVEFRVGSEQSPDQREYATYTAAVPVSDEVWFEGSYKSLSSNDPSQKDDAFSGTIDWRFRKNWSLRTEFGSIGTGVDLLWQYRY